MTKSEDHLGVELADLERRLRASGPLALAVLALSWLAAVPAAAPALAVPVFEIPWSLGAELALASAVVFWGGAPLLERAWRSVKLRAPDGFTLVGLAATTAYVCSALAVLFPAIVPPAFDAAHRPPVHFDSAAFVVTLALLGRVLQLRVLRRAGARLEPPEADDATAGADGARRGGPAGLLAQLVGAAPATPRRARPQGLAERAAALFVPLVVMGAGLTLVTWDLLGPDPRLANGLQACVSVLVAACPGAVGLPAPLSMVGAIPADTGGAAAAAAARAARRSLAFGLVYHAVALPAAAGALLPWLRVVPHPMVAATAATLAGLAVVTLSLRVRQRAR